MKLEGKRYLIVSYYGFPFGGGEDFLYQTMEWAYSFKMIPIWLCFSTSVKLYEEFAVEDCFQGIIIKVPGGLDNNLENWIRILKPDIIHHQGLKRREILNITTELRINTITGYHFWNGLIQLNPETYNKNIMKNISLHKKDPELDEMQENNLITAYVCSDFVSDVVKKVCNIELPIIYPSSSYQLKTEYNPERKYITLVNIHKLKGGLILLELMKNLPYLFIGIKTEPGSEELDLELELLAKKTGSKIINHTKIKSIYKKTRILLIPSIVDETFCRTANEGLMSGIPILTTGAGNIKYMIEDTRVILGKDPKKWIKKVKQLYENKEMLKELSKRNLERYQMFSEVKSIELFKIILTNTIIKSKENNVMIYAPWCDQGLGIQSRNYAEILKKKGVKVFIFSFKPYNGDNIGLQKNPEEWIGYGIYYSKNNREEVKDIEIINFIKTYNIGKCLIPETCWYRIFEIARLLEKNNVKSYAIPNIEIVRKDEIHKHRYFHKILCNNKICYDIFTKYGFKNIEKIGYAINTENIGDKNTNMDTIYFLNIGGMNAFSRKQTLEVCEAFDKAVNILGKEVNIKLIVTMYKFIDQRIYKYYTHENIELIMDHLTYKDIKNLYQKAHINIQVSIHEGLGLGFYESLNAEVPVLTLNTQPHNEIIHDKINGWLLECTQKPMIDNNNGLVMSSYFEIDNLVKLIIDISKNKSKIITITKNIKELNQKNIKTFKSKFIKSLGLD